MSKKMIFEPTPLGHFLQEVSQHTEILMIARDKQGGKGLCLQPVQPMPFFHLLPPGGLGSLLFPILLAGRHRYTSRWSGCSGLPAATSLEYLLPLGCFLNQFPLDIAQAAALQVAHPK